MTSTESFTFSLTHFCNTVMVISLLFHSHSYIHTSQVCRVCFITEGCRSPFCGTDRRQLRPFVHLVYDTDTHRLVSSKCMIQARSQHWVVRIKYALAVGMPVLMARTLFPMVQCVLYTGTMSWNLSNTNEMLFHIVKDRPYEAQGRLQCKHERHVWCQIRFFKWGVSKRFEMQRLRLQKKKNK